MKKKYVNWKKVAYSLAKDIYKSDIVDTLMESINAESEGMSIKDYKADYIEGIVKEAMKGTNK